MNGSPIETVDDAVDSGGIADCLLTCCCCCCCCCDDDDDDVNGVDEFCGGDDIIDVVAGIEYDCGLIAGSPVANLTGWGALIEVGGSVADDDDDDDNIVVAGNEER